MADEKACGAIIFTNEGNVRKYLILRGVGAYQSDYGFPKGHVEEGETERETALREVKEETGLDIVLYDDFRTVDEHALAREGRPNDKKTNVYFLAEYHDQELVAQKSEVSEIVLMDYQEAMRCIQYEESRRELTEAEEYLNRIGTIKLVEPSLEYAADIWAFRAEILEKDADTEDQFAGCMSLDTSSSAEEWIEICRLRKSEETCQKVGTAVPSHMYLAVRKSDNRIVGIIDLRHHIDHPILGTWGGHCGYSVRPSERGKGYAKEMLRLNIQNARTLGIEKMLITCDVDNTASEKTILGNGGVFENTIEVDGTVMKRYWITV